MEELKPIPSSLREKFLEELLSHNEIMIIHHWDTDGIASASLMKEFLEKQGVHAKTFVPQLGVYSQEAIDADPGESDALLIVDYALRASDVHELEKRFSKPVLVIDHHMNDLPRDKRYLNTHIHDLGYYPSTTTVLKELLGLEWGLCTIIGVVGDLGPRAPGIPLWKEVSGILEKNGWSFEELYKLTLLIDSTYKCLNRELVRRSVEKLREYCRKNDLESALRDPEWLECAEIVSREEQRLLSTTKPVRVGEDILVYRVSSRYLLVSSVGRKLSLSNPNSIIVVVYRLLGTSRGYVYVRSQTRDFSRVIQDLRSKGLSVGGKPEVFSVEVDESRQSLEQVSSLVLESLTSQLKNN